MSVDLAAAVKHAVVRGQVAKVTSLLKGVEALPAAAATNGTAANGSSSAPSLVYEAVSRGHIAIAMCLLDYGASPLPSEGSSLLVSALKCDGAKLIEPLLASLGDQAAAAVCEHVREWTPLMHAAKTGSVKAMRALLAANADVDAKMLRHGGTALMVAVQYTQLEAVTCLLGAGASTALTDAQGWTALQWAAQNGALEPLRALVEHASVDAARSAARRP